MTRSIRILFTADSHIGTDLPVRPRIERRRRGEDFLDNHARALEPALNGEVDVVVHGGDVFDHPRIRRDVALRAYAPLLAVADRGVPVFIVPGNHERSALPHSPLLRHPRVEVFDRPRTFTVSVAGTELALAGFPYERRDVRHNFTSLLDATSWRNAPADLRLLCVHHCIEGATVGPGDYTFTNAADVIRHRDVPAEFAAVLSGHIHRQQVLTHDLRRRPLRTPVFYPGSVERTSTAEIGEEKGYLMLELQPDGRIDWQSRPLPARPLAVEELDAAGMNTVSVCDVVASIIGRHPSDAVLRIRVRNLPPGARLPNAATLRSLAPATMNVELQAPGLFRGSGRGAAAKPQRAGPHAYHQGQVQLESAGRNSAGRHSAGPDGGDGPGSPLGRRGADGPRERGGQLELGDLL